MDFNDDFSSVQSILNYANEYIKPLHKIQFRGGNEPYILDTCTKIAAFFQRKGYIDGVKLQPLPEHFNELRKITFFLMLNTEASFKYDLTNDYTICHLLNVLPKLPKCLLHACVWGLSLERFFCECIAYAPLWFGFQFIENIVESLKYADPYETLDRVDQLMRAIYTSIARSDFRHMEIVDHKIILNKFFDIAMDLLRHFYSPDAEKFQNWSKNKYRKYTGYVLRHNLNMILHCFELFQQKPILKSDPIEFDIYALMKEREPLIDDHQNFYSDVVNDTLHRMNTTLLNSLQYNVMQVDCHTFMYWVEIDIDDEHTLQRLIGEAAFKVEQMINVNESFTHDVSNQLKSISIKPLTVEDLISQSTVGDLIEKLERLAETSDENIVVWLNAFINRGELVLGNTECLETIELHIRSLTIPMIKQLILSASQVEEEDCIEEKLIEICVSSLDHLSDPQILELIQYSIDQQKHHFSYMQLENFEQSLTEVFNKSTFSQDRCAYLKLLFQNPQLFYDRVLDEALTTEMQMTHMMEILRHTSELFKHFITNQVKGLIESKSSSDDPRTAQLIPKLLSQIFFLNILQPDEFIVDLLYKQNIVAALKSTDFHRLLLLMTCLTIISTKFKFDGIAPPLLVMSAQVLELSRWNLVKFADEKVAVVTKTIEFITTLMKYSLPNTTGSEKTWVVNKIAMYCPLTRYYFQKLSIDKEQTPKSFDEFIKPSDASWDTQHRVKFLCENIVRCNSKELSWLAKNDQLLPHFWNAFRLVSTIVARSKQAQEVNCLKYSCTAFLPIVEKSLLNDGESEMNRASTLIELFKFFTNLREMPFVVDLVGSAQPLLLNNIDKITQHDIKTHFQQKFGEFVSSLPKSQSKDLLTQKMNTL